jgi:hypothetical protein
MNHVIHIAATTQIRLDTEGRAYYRRKLAAGKTRMEAMRCLKRRISDALYRQLVADARASETGPGGHCGASLTSSAVDLPPAHRHFGSATSRTRETDATTAVADPEDTSPHDRLTTEGSRNDAPSSRHVRYRRLRQSDGYVRCWLASSSRHGQDVEQVDP